MSKWEWKKLGEVCDSINGLWKGKKEPFIKVGVIRNTNFTKNCRLDMNPSKLEFLDVEKKQYDKRKLLFGDLIVEKSGGSEKQPVGRVVLFEEKEGEYSFSNFTSVLRIKNDDEIECHFLHLQLYKLYLDGVTKQMQSATTGIHNLDFDQFKDLSIGIPPLSEQKRIVKFLDEEFSKIETLKTNAETNLKNSRELFNVELEKSFLGKNGWKTVRLGDCGKLKNGMNLTASDSGYTIHSLGVGDFKNLYQINDTKVLSKISLNAPPPEDYLLKDGDIVFVRSNGNKELVGRCVLVYPRKTPTTYSGFCIRFRKEFEQLDSDFLLHFMKSDNSRKILNGKEGANISNLNQKILGDFQIPLPPLSVQKEIVARLDKLSENVKRLEANYKQIIADCDELKKSILKKTFEGES